MKVEFSTGDAKQLIELARRAISYCLATGELLADLPADKKFEEKQGVFVTLKTYPKGELRGCIGLPYPVEPLWQGTIQAATSAAFSDPRFPRLEADELENVTIEISILSMPEEIACKKSELPKKINAGRDGLIVKKGSRSGLLLPQVATENGLDSKRFLELTCRKATLPETTWMSSSCNVFKFRAQVFREKTPHGEVVEEKEPSA